MIPTRYNTEAGVAAGDNDRRPAGRSKPPEIAVIGGGSAAFAAAIRLQEENVRVTMIERGTIGGTCVNTGCVPSKILINAARVAHVRTNSPFDGGISAAAPVVDLARLHSQQQTGVDELRRAKYELVLDQLPNIRLVQGEAKFLDSHTVVIKRIDGSEVSSRFDRALVATGASPAIPAVEGLSGTPYWTSTEALASPDLPGHLIVYGGSYVALELAQAFLRLGSKVTMIVRSRILSHSDPLIGDVIQQVLTEEGMRILTGTQIEKVGHDGKRFAVVAGGESIHGDRLLIATGREPNTAALSLRDAGVATDENGSIVVDGFLRTSNPDIYAAGDCTTNPKYVYVAGAAGTKAADNMFGGDEAFDLSVVPAVVFTDPRIATVGFDESGAQRNRVRVDTRTLTLDSVPRALANFDTRGFIKLVAERKTGRLLGAQVVASQAGELIETASLAIRAHMTVNELASQLFPYLTMVEGLKLAAQAFTRNVKQLSCCAG